VSDPAIGDYERGHAAGTISERLREHDRHFERINGSMDMVGLRLGELVMQVQRLADAAQADRATVVTTAAALKAAEDARRTKAESSWSPLGRLALIAGILASLGGVVAVVLALIPH
jgi:hypothetical protein